MQKKDNGKLPLSGADIVLLALLVIGGMGLWSLADRTLSEFFHDWQPDEQLSLERDGVVRQTDDVSRLEEEVKTFEKKLTETRIEQLANNSNLRAFTGLYPDLGREKASLKSIPPDTVKAYQELRRQELQAGLLEQSLKTELGGLRTRLAKTTSELATVKAASNRKFHQTKAEYLLLKPFILLVMTFIPVLALLLFVRWFIPGSARPGMLATTSSWPFILAIGVLLILFGYQAFEMAGAAVIGIFLLLILLGRIQWPVRKGDIAKKQ
jgi:hypothetical protein